MEEQRDPGMQESSGVPAGTPAAAAENVASPKRRERYTVEQKQAILDEFGRAGMTVREFCAQHRLSTKTFCGWRQRREAEGDAGLKPRPNRRNHTRRTGRRATLAERKAAVEAFLKSGATREQFARTWGMTAKTLAAWLKAYQASPSALAPKKPGPRRGAKHRRLSAIAQEILRIKQRFPLFGLRKVRDYLLRFVGIRVSKSRVRSTLEAAGVPPTIMVLASPSPSTARA